MTTDQRTENGGSAAGGESVDLDLSEPVEPESMSLDVVFDVLSNSRRRLILSRLQETDGESTTSDLAEYIAAVENDKPRSELTSQERKRVYVGIYQTHLPKMDEAGVVEVDDRGDVRLGPNADPVYRFLESPNEDDTPWPVYYAALTGLSGLALLVGWLALQPFLAALFALALLGYAGLVGVHARSVDVL